MVVNTSWRNDLVGLSLLATSTLVKYLWAKLEPRRVEHFLFSLSVNSQLLSQILEGGGRMDSVDKLTSLLIH